MRNGPRMVALAGITLALAALLPAGARAASGEAEATAPGRGEILEPPHRLDTGDPDGVPVYATDFLSPVYTVDKVYPSKSLELYDRTADKTVFKSTPEQRTDQVGLARVETFSSQEGLPLYKDHEYDLISVYNNTSSVPRDAMATMLLYVHAKDLYDFDFRPHQKAAAATP